MYRARDMHFPNVTKRVAVKEMISQVRDPSMRETIVRNFEREANLLATLEHPAIPKIYDYFTQNDRSYLILEFIDGKDLETVLVDTQGFFPESQIISWGIELCDVLSFLHNHQPEPIIFRDMKPSNVMVDQRGHIILVDFGIAKTFQTGQKGTMIGTEGYSPPEQYKGEAGPLSDIYALGATLHHLLTRRDPRLEAPFSFTERPIRSINPAVSIELETVVNSALHYNPQNRLASVAMMKEALLGVARKTGVLSSLRALSSEYSQVGDSSKLVWSFETEDEIRGSPAIQDGVIYIGSYDHNLYALNADNGSFLWKYAADGGIVTRPFIYDGNAYFGSEDKRLHVVSNRSGKIVWSYYAEAPVRSSPAIGVGHVFFGADDGFLHAVNTLTGRRAQTFEDTVQVDVPAELLPKTIENSSVYWKALPLRPGRYRMDLVVKDVNGDRLGTWSKGIQVPDFGDDKLTSSTLILADLMEPVAPKNVGSGSFVIGTTKVRPRVESSDGKPARFKRSQDLNFWMQVYNLGVDEKTNQPSATFEYDVVNTADNKAVLTANESTSQMGNLGDQVTLQKRVVLRDLEPGTYQVTVKVNDNISKQSIAPSAKFIVE